MSEHEHSHGHPHVHGHVHDPEQTKKISNRLARAIGHLESIKKMVEDDRDCSEVLIQLAAVESAIRSTSRQILRNHMETCVTAAIQQNDEETLSELYRAIDELLGAILHKKSEKAAGPGRASGEEGEHMVLRL